MNEELLRQFGLSERLAILDDYFNAALERFDKADARQQEIGYDIGLLFKEIKECLFSAETARNKEPEAELGEVESHISSSVPLFLLGNELLINEDPDKIEGEPHKVAFDSQRTLPDEPSNTVQNNLDAYSVLEPTPFNNTTVLQEEVVPVQALLVESASNSVKPACKYSGMTTAQEIRRKYGLDDKLRVLNQRRVPTEEVLLAEELETKGIKRLFREMDKSHAQEIGSNDFLAGIKRNDIPISKNVALDIFKAYSKNGRLDFSDFKKIVQDAQPLCERQVAEQKVRSIYEGCNITEDEKKPNVPENEMILLAKRELAARCAERYHNKQEILHQLYNSDSTITKQSLARFIAKMLPEMPEQADQLAQSVLEYQQENVAYMSPSRIPITENGYESKESVSEQLFEKAVFHLLEEHADNSACYRKDQDMLTECAERETEEEPEPREAAEQDEESSLNDEEQPNCSCSARDQNEPLEIGNLQVEDQGIQGTVSINDIANEAYREATELKLRNLARETSSAFDFAEYGEDEPQRAQSVAYNARIPLWKLQKGDNQSVLDMRVDAKEPCAIPAYKRAFRNEKIRAAAALLHSIEKSTNEEEFESNLFHFAPDVSLSVVKELSEYARDPERLAELTGLQDEMRAIEQSHQFVEAETKKFVGNETKLSQKCPCIPTYAETLGDGGKTYTQEETALHNRSNNSQLVHEVFGTELGDGSNISEELTQLHPNPFNLAVPPERNIENQLSVYRDVAASIEREEQQTFRARSAVHLESRIRSGVSDSEERPPRRRSSVNNSHDIFSYEADPVPRKKYTNSSVVGSVICGEGAV